MSKKRQSPVLDPHGIPDVELTTLSHDFESGHEVPPHFHKEDQLVFACKGVMTIRTAHGIWVVPPLRAVWIPGDEIHSIVTGASVLMRTLYFAPHIVKLDRKKCFVLNVSPLFRELILHACLKPHW